MDEVGKDSWKDFAGDPTQHTEIIKALLMHYTGRDELEEPSRMDLAKLMGEYTKTTEYSAIEASIVGGGTITEMLESI